MANALYDKAREEFLGGTLSWSSDDIRAVLVDTALHTIDLAAADPALANIAAGARRATSGALASKTIAAGVADAADVIFSAVTGDPAEVVVLYKHTGVEATSRLIAAIDTASGLPVTPNGGDVQVTWDAGANKIFRL